MWVGAQAPPAQLPTNDPFEQVHVITFADAHAGRLVVVVLVEMVVVEVVVVVVVVLVVVVVEVVVVG